jgi:hypothetical protein
MKIKNNFFESNGLIELAKLRDMDLAIKDSYAVCKIVKALEESMKIYADAKTDLFKKHGDAEGEAITVSEEKKPAFLKDLQELLDIEVELEFKPIKLPDDTKVSPKFIQALEKFLDLE